MWSDKCLMAQPPWNLCDFFLHVLVCQAPIVYIIRVTKSEIKSHEFEDIYSLCISHSVFVNHLIRNIYLYPVQMPEI